jgi:hypothetical protein
LTTGSALTFDGTNLGVGGTSGYETANRTTIAAAGVNSALLGFKVGGTSAGYAFADASHLEFGAPTGRYLSWDINGEKMRLTSTGLGIGTSDPAYKLDVTGAIKASSSIRTTGSDGVLSANTSVLDYVAGSTTRLISYGPNTTTPGAIQFVGLSSNAGAGDVRATIDSSGNLGIGTSPAATYSRNVQIDGTASAGLRFTSTSYTAGFDVVLSAGDAYLLNRNNTALIFSTNATERARITSAGLVGIGTDSPASGYRLDVAGAMRLGEGANLSWGNTYADNGPTVAGSSAGGFLAFYPNGLASGEGMRLTSTGNVGIGTTSPGSTRLSVRLNTGGTDAGESLISATLGDNASHVISPTDS